MIRTKRDSLEKFLREQMEGPGACNGQFYCLSDSSTQESDEEVINTTPGSLYSTAVLFPQRKQKTTEDPDEENQASQVEPDVESDSSYQESQEDNSSEELDEQANRLGADDEDLYSLSQRFPTTIGVSCCLDKNGGPIVASDLTIRVSGRYYTKISKQECCKIVVRVEDLKGFSEFYNAYMETLAPFFLFRMMVCALPLILAM